MGFFRRLYRDSCAGRSDRARMLLADGEYAEAASEFGGCGMYREAADAYVKAGEREPDTFYYQWAAENYAKAGYFDAMRGAYEEHWRVKGEALSIIDKLKVHGQLEQFCRHVRDHRPADLVSALEYAGEVKLAADMYEAAADLTDDPEERSDCLSGAARLAVKAGVDTRSLLRLHEKLFKAEVASANHGRTILFHVVGMRWIIESASLSEFVDDLVNESPVFMWYVLNECRGHLGDTEADSHALFEKNGTELAKGMLRCIKAAENRSASQEEWEFVDSGHWHHADTASLLAKIGMFPAAAEMYALGAKQAGNSRMLTEAARCWKQAHQPLKAAEVLEQLGEFIEAAGLAGDAGRVNLAIRLYERALEADTTSDTEAEWIKTTVKRLHKL